MAPPVESPSVRIGQSRDTRARSTAGDGEAEAGAEWGGIGEGVALARTGLRDVRQVIGTCQWNWSPGRAGGMAVS
jgi:hypothetical protein